jgi:stage IV sporulation protein B
LKARQIAGLLIFVMISTASLLPSFQGWLSLPSTLHWEAGRRPSLPTPPGLHLISRRVRPRRTVVAWTLWGVPVRVVTVADEPVQRVLLGGGSIGVLLRGEGAVVVGEQPVWTSLGPERPAYAAGLRVGDEILAVDGKRVREEEAFAAAIDDAGRRRRDVRLLVARRGRRFVVSIRPRYDLESGRHRIGVLVKARISGVGTLTFVDPASRRWAALGHVVLGQDQKPLSAPKGVIAPAPILAVLPGRRGDPGRKVGVIDAATPLGVVDRNSEVGLTGRLTVPPGPGRLLPVATVDEVHTGPAVLWTVVGGREPQAYSVRIERLLHPARPTAKAFILRVTDPRLLRLTGGIVQGMSGSPIVQDGRLVGAVTHVFVQDPTRGFGVYASWMLTACRTAAAGKSESKAAA